MWTKEAFIAICLQVVLQKTVQSQRIGPPLIASETLVAPNMALDTLTPVMGRVIGGNLIVDTSAGEPSGVSIFSDDIFFEGPVLVTGNLPFLGAVALEGIVPTTGSSAVAYECGNGNIDMAEQSPVSASTVVPSAPGFGLGGSISRLGRL